MTEEREEDLIYDHYVEKATSLIYEAKLFDGFAIVRPADPWFHAAIKKVDLEDFAEEFEQFIGDSRAIRVAYSKREIGDVYTIH